MNNLEEIVRLAVGAEQVRLGPRLQVLWDGYGEIRRATVRGGSASSVIVKRVLPPDAASLGPDRAARFAHRRKLRSYDVELAFYERYAPRCGASCRVARALHLGRVDDGWLFVLEDLDEAGFVLRRARPSNSEIAACLVWLAEFHAEFLGQAPEGLWPVGSYWHLDTRPDELRALSDPTVRSAAPLLDAALNGARFQSLVHGDAKLANFCFDGNGAVAAVDFQYVGGGPGIKDVAYCLSSCLPPAECEASADRYLKLYFDALGRAVETRGARLDCTALEREWRALYPIAWADFWRFLLGWSKESYPLDDYSRRLIATALAELDVAGTSNG